jgi:RNA polymerase sigma-70 factor, ECF subfamily
MMANESMLALATALDALPVDYRTVIMLRNIQGMPFKEVAQVMDRSVDSVEKLWVRGLARLKQEMDSVNCDEA